MTEHNRTGTLGEDITLEYLKKHGFRLVERNYSKKWGEIDLVVQRRGITHFIEVKSTTLPADQTQYPDPVERVDTRKVRRLSRAVQTYAAHKRISLDPGTWQCDVCVVYIDRTHKHAQVKCIENILLNGR